MPEPRFLPAPVAPADPTSRLLPVPAGNRVALPGIHGRLTWTLGAPRA